MTWAVRFRGKDFKLEDNFDPVFEYVIREELRDITEVSGSVSIVFYGDEMVVNITFEDSPDPHELPFTGIHGQHPKLGDVYIFYSAPDDDLQAIALYDADDFGDLPLNEESFPLEAS